MSASANLLIELLQQINFLTDFVIGHVATTANLLVFLLITIGTGTGGTFES